MYVCHVKVVTEGRFCGASRIKGVESTLGRLGFKRLANQGLAQLFGCEMKVCTLHHGHVLFAVFVNTILS